ncbi:MAG: hypothetical protein ACI81S_002339, partial [Sphingobacteriales bacterium]
TWRQRERQQIPEIMGEIKGKNTLQDWELCSFTRIRLNN